MDFLERLFHINPDGGSGATEMAYILLATVVVIGLAFRRRIVIAIRRRKEITREPEA